MPLPRRLLAAASVLLLSVYACGSTPEEQPAPAPAPASTIVDAAPPEVDAGPGTCLEELTRRGVAFRTTTARGVVDAVFVTDRLGGVLFASETKTTPSTDPMACAFVLRLLDLAEVLRAHGVSHVGTLGAYCYRCCCAWSPTNDCRSPTDPEPDCGTNGYSNHSWGRALDLRYVYRDDGRMLDINDAATWVKTAADGTCTTGLAAQKGDSLFLYELACDIWKKQIFETTLTPNYNAAHRNHWHMDIGESGAPTSFGIKRFSPAGRPVDTASGAPGCGDE